MNLRTKQIALVAGLVFVVCVVAVLFFVREINSQVANLSEQIIAIETDRAQQIVFSRIKKTDQETQVTRDKLKSYYLQSQSDSIDFLNYIEEQAQISGVELSTGSPTEVERSDTTYLSVGYTFKGSLNRVEVFLQKLENIPYVSQLQSLKISQQAENVWQAEVVIEVNVLNYEK